MTTRYLINGVDTDTLYIRKDKFVEGNLWTWGYNATGALGDNTITPRSSPVQTVTGGTNWKQVAGGYYSNSSIKSDGTLWVWGDNTYGQLGDNSTTNKSSPVQTIAGGTNWKQVSHLYHHTAAIKTDGTLWTWGDNTYGQLGDNSTTNKSSPVQTIVGGTNWRQVSAGLSYTAAIKTDGTLWTWGDNSAGQLGSNTVSFSTSPIQTVAAGTNWRQVSSGAYHTAAIKTDGTLWLWGNNTYGQLGNNSSGNFPGSPIQTVAAGTNWRQVSVIAYETLAIKTDGTLWGWGQNNGGMLGDNTTTSRSSPVQTIAGGTTWRLISNGAAIKTDGTLWCWGPNAYGPIGDNSAASKSSPVQTIMGGTNWTQISKTLSTTAGLIESPL